MKKFKIGMAMVALATALSGCAVGPDFESPKTPTGERFIREGSEFVSTTESVAGNTQFWSGFQDVLLSEMIHEALIANRDIKVAMSRYDEAAAFLSAARLDRFPTVTASGRVGHQLLSKDQAFGAPRDARDTPVSGMQINATWELDLFGRVRRSIESQDAEALATAADAQAMRIAIVGEVASTYVSLRGAQERLRIADANVKNQRDTFDLIQSRYDAGRSSELDVSRARAQLETTMSRIAAYKSIVGVAEHRLVVLTGMPAEGLVKRLDLPGPMPRLERNFDPGSPTELLRRRPDVAAAEARLHAATARIGVATADLFPRVTLGGLIGSVSNSYGFFRAGSETGLIAFGVDWSFLDVGRVRARISASEAGAAGRLAQYQQVVELALEDAETTLLRSRLSAEEAALLERAARSSAMAANLAGERFRAGAIDYYQVLDVQRTQLEAEDSAAQAVTRSSVATVQLYKAFAGGWTPGEAVSAQ